MKCSLKTEIKRIKWLTEIKRLTEVDLLTVTKIAEKVKNTFTDAFSFRVLVLIISIFLVKIRDA